VARVGSKGVKKFRVDTGAAILDALVRLGGPGRRLSRDEIASHAGIARSTVSAALKDFRKIERYRVRHGEVPIALFSHGGREPKSGEREYVSLNPDAGYFGCLELSHRRITVAVANMFGEIAHHLDWKSDRFPVEDDPDGAVEHGAEMLEKVVGPLRISRIAAIGLAVAAPVDPFTAEVLDVRGNGSSRGWVGTDPRAMLRAALGWNCPMTIANDASLAAFDEFLERERVWKPIPREETRHVSKADAGSERQLEALLNMLHLKWSSGVGAGLIIHGRHYAGAAGLAGEIGHARVPHLERRDRPTEPCLRCGRIECLENVVSYRRLRFWLKKGGLAEEEVEEMERHDIDVHPLAQEPLIRFAGYIGQVLAGPVAALNPQIITIGGPTPQADLASAMVNAIQRNLAEWCSLASAQALRGIYITESRWSDIGDPEGRLAVAAGAIRRARFYFGWQYAWNSLANTLLKFSDKTVEPPVRPLPVRLAA